MKIELQNGYYVTTKPTQTSGTQAILFNNDVKHPLCGRFFSPGSSDENIKEYFTKKIEDHKQKTEVVNG